MKHFIPLTIVITGLCGLFYLIVQQTYRVSANDPQLQFSYDIASSLNNGTPPQAIIPPTKVDMAKSLAVFIMIFDTNERLLLSTGEIAGKVPEVPTGVFDFVKRNGEDRITWQPQKGVRNAIVVTKYKDGYILVGRSLKEVEKREDMLLKQVMIGWLLILLAGFIAKSTFSQAPHRLRRE